MAAAKPEKDRDFGVFERTDAGARITSTEVIALIMSLVWLAGSGLFFLFVSRGGGGVPIDTAIFVMTFITIFVPVALIWVAASAARSARMVREESERLHDSIDGLRATFIAQAQAASARTLTEGRARPPRPRPSAAHEADGAAFASRRESAVTAPGTPAAVEPPTAEPEETVPTAPQDAPAASPAATAEAVDDAGEEEQLFLPGTRVDAPDPLPSAIFILALNFPRDADDTLGFDALRQAMRRRKVAQLVRAAQDVLTLLSEDGIYMDDLVPDRSRVEIWRRFAQGERGPAISGLGGIRDRSCLALASQRLRADPVFRDAVHHFLRLFDHSLAAFEPEASDEELAALSETRTARAFMLLGRVAGTFDGI